MAGVISAVVQIAYCISFAALIFTGDLAGGFPLGLAGLIMGTVVTCVVIAVTSTFAGHRRPRLAGGGGDERACRLDRDRACRQGASTDQIIVNVLVALSVSTLLTGSCCTGSARFASASGSASFRILWSAASSPRPASCSSPAAEVVTQTDLTLLPSSWALLYSKLYGPQILVAILFAAAIPVAARVGARLPCAPARLLRLSRWPQRRPVRRRQRRWRPRRLVLAGARRAQAGGPQRHGRGPGRLARDRAEQRRDRVLLRRHGDRASARRSASKSRARNPAISIKSSARTVLPICSPRCSAASADRCR